MTDSEFVLETSRIEKYYGKELDEFQRKIWHEEIGHLSLPRYRQIVKEIFKTSKFMPKLADIIEINNTLAYEKKERITEEVECSKCDGKGFLIYTKLYDNGTEKIPYDYLARCTCANGEQYSYNGQNVSDSRHRSNYYVPNVVELGI